MRADALKAQRRAPNARAFDVRTCGDLSIRRSLALLLLFQTGLRDPAGRYFRFSSFVTV